MVEASGSRRSAATEALAMQFGLTPVEAASQHRRARAANSTSDLDAAMDAIRLPTEGGPPHRACRVVTPSSRRSKASAFRPSRRSEPRAQPTRVEPGAEDRARKLRTRIEEALHVAAEHRREEEILIATAAIEERLRRGHIDDAAQRLADLAERHGSSAPVAELREQLAEARALAHQSGAQTGAAAETVDDSNADRGQPASMVWQSMVDEEARDGRSRWIAIAVVVAIVLAGLGGGRGDRRARLESRFRPTLRSVGQRDRSARRRRG
jgi:hypothetical protein